MGLELFFNNSSYAYFDKQEEFSLEDQKIIDSLILNDKIRKFHPDRKKEFIIGRLLAYKCYLELTQKKLIKLESQEDRSPQWPDDVVGSITHNSKFVIVTMALKNELSAIGIDIEEKGRTKLELSSHIKTDKDLLSHDDFSSAELLTLIFSAKESLFKLLHPLVKTFFGFEAAYVSAIDSTNKTFEIHLITKLSEEFGPLTKGHFSGSYFYLDNSLITKITLK